MTRGLALPVCKTIGKSRRYSGVGWILIQGWLWAIFAPAFCAAAPLEIEEAPAPLEERANLSQEMQDRLHAAAIFSAGRVSEQRDDEPAALAKYQRAFRYDATPTVLRDILRLAASLERYDEAVRYALLATDNGYVDEELLRPLALVLTQQGDWEPALELYEVLLREQNIGLPEDLASPPNFTELTIRQEATRLYFLTDRFADGAEVCLSIEAALAEPEKFKLTPAQQKELLGEPNLTYHLFAECHLAADQFDAASKCFETAQEHQPNAGLFGYNMARVKQKQGQSEQGLAYLQAYFSAKLAGEGATPYILLGEFLAALKQSDKFDERLSQLRTADPENVALLLFIAERHLKEAKFDLAEPIYAQLAKSVKKRNADEIYAGLLQCQFKLQKLEPLLQSLGETESKAGSAVVETAMEPIAADEKLRLKLIELARERRSPAAAKLPPANESWTMAELALAGKDVATAQEFFEFALQDQPQRRSELLETFGVMLLLGDHSAEAAAIFRRGAEDEDITEERPSFQYYLAGALAMLDETDKALAVARKAAAAEPEDPRYATRVAWILQRAKRYDEALAVYLDLLKKFDNRYDSSAVREAMRDAKQTVSNLYVLQDNFKLGVEYLEQVLDEFPSHAGALNDLGYLWAERGLHLQRAKRMIEQAVAAEPENRAFLDSLGWVEYRLENYQAAQQALEKAIAGEEKPDGEILDHLGDVYFKLKDADKAKQHWQRALEALPTDTDEARRKEIEAKLRSNAE
jgi:tetratricopeptide (TPR) repeat protein